MKRTLSPDMILVAVFIGIAIGILLQRWLSVENAIAQHGARLLVLEADHAERLKFKARAKTVWGIALRFVHKFSFGLIKRD